MAIHLKFRRGVPMRNSLGGLVAVAAPFLVLFLVLGFGLGGNASAALDVDAAVGSVTKAGGRPGVLLAKAKKRKRPAASKSKPDTGDDSSSSGDDDAGKSAAASSDTSDDAEAKEDAALGTSSSKKKKAPAPVADDSDASSSKGGDSDDGAPSKNVESVSAKASEEPPASTGRPSALEFGLGGKAMFRSLAWSGGANAGLGPYSLTPGPETGLWLEFYPAAFGTNGFAANVGIFGRFDYGFGVATTLANGMDAATRFRDFMAGLKVRIPVGTFTPNLSVAYGQQVFEIAQQQSMADLPQVAYQFVRPAVGTRVMFTPTVGLDMVAGYLLVLDPGSGADHIRSSRYFPKATSYGIDASASVAFRLSGSIGGRVGADWRQYGIALNPDSSTRMVAGAVDRYIVAWAGLEVVLDGQSGAAGGDDAPAKPPKRRRRHAPEPKPDDSDESSDSSSSKSSDSSDD